jgi:hypothetical protein
MLIYNSGQISRDFHVTRIWPLYLGFDATRVLELYLVYTNVFLFIILQDTSNTLRLNVNLPHLNHLLYLN